MLDEGNEYFVNIQGVKKRNQSEYIYTFGQLGLVDGTQLTGEGKIELTGALLQEGVKPFSY